LRLKADLTLLLVAVVWGSGFIAQRLASASGISVFWINGLRTFLGVLVLLPFIRFRLALPRNALWPTLAAGLALFGGGTLQQVGLITTTASNAGFITGTYVVLIPILLLLFWRKHTAWFTWLATALATAGLALLSLAGSLRLNPGDLFELGGACLWALHVILVGRVVQRANFLHFAIGQYLVVGVLNLVLALATASSQVPSLPRVGWPVLYLGIVSTGIGFTLQGMAQRHSPPADAAIILSMESVFAALFGFLLLGERLTWLQWLGCLLILTAILLSQWKVLRSGSDERTA
jgi:drug/metabolite transporter (DMT)-like permease